MHKKKIIKIWKPHSDKPESFELGSIITERGNKNPEIQNESENQIDPINYPQSLKKIK